MFLAMNRFKVVIGSEAAFEELWRLRESHLHEMPGFVAFHMMRGPHAADHTLYASHTVWESEANFLAWTKSEQFRKAHANAGNADTRALYLEPPVFEGFTAVQSVARDGTRQDF